MRINPEVLDFLQDVSSLAVAVVFTVGVTLFGSGIADAFATWVRP